MNVKKVFVVLFIVMIASVSFLSGQKVVVMEEVLKPRFITMDEKQLYISETDATVSIFNADNFKFIKKFGKAGEGPKEFLRIAFVTPLKDKLLINSLGKISFFSKDGVYQNEIKSPGGAAAGFGFLPIKGGYVVNGRTGDDNGIFTVINFFDKKLVKVRELARVKMAEKGYAKINVLSSNIPFQVHKNTIFIPEEKGFVVNAIDSTGKHLFKIERKDYKQRKFTNKVEKELRDLIKKQSPQQYEIIKNRLLFPKYFPIFSFFYKDAKTEMIYLFTWKFEDENFECFIYNMKGEFQKRVEVPFKMQAALQPYPLNIYNWKVYQLIDNDETENWEMHITDIKH